MTIRAGVEALEGIPTIVAAQALGYLKANTVLARLVARNWSQDVATYGKTVKIPRRGSLSVNDKAEGSTVTLQNPSLTSVSVTLDKHKEVSFLVEDTAEALSRPAILQGYVEDGMAVIAEQIDSDIAALYSGLSQSIDATAGLTEANFREARRLLNAAKTPLRDRFFVLGEDAEYEFLGIDKAVNTQYRQALGGALATSYTGQFMGFAVFMDQMIPTVTGTPSEVKNLAFHRNAFVLVTRPLPAAPAELGVYQRVMAEDGFGLRVTLSYDSDYLGWKCTIDVLYGVAELNDDHGVVVRTTAI